MDDEKSENEPRGEARDRIGPYEVVAHIGAGGMGQVYRARDPRLDREVALKVLPDEFTSDPDRIARFEREAKVLASLDHPNIGHIYGLEEAGNLRALVLELVEGPTLADRIAGGPIPLEQALPIARQIAEALEAAHRRGIIHRDLKPANVKVKTDGTVKVLDFGLAKALQPEADEPDPAASPTLTAATRAGVILGTAAYMAPEQARGRPVDKRADIWAFGAVLFEMLSGTRAFAAEDVSGTLARVIEREPDWEALPRDLPPVLRAFLERCLAKDPRRRIHDIADMRLVIEGAFDPTLAAEVALVSRPRAWQRPTMVSLMVAGAAVVAALLGWYAAPRPTDRGALRFAVTAPPGVRLTGNVLGHSLALSPDGRRFAFVAKKPDEGPRLWLLALDRDAAEPLDGTESAHSPFWSPDGRWLAYFTPTHLMKLRPGAGPPEAVCRTRGRPAATWRRDDTILFAVPYGETRGLYLVDAGGGEPRPIRLQDTEDHLIPSWPVWLPDGKRFLYVAYKRTDTDEGAVPYLHVGEVDSGHARRLFPIDSRVEIAPGHLVYVERGTLLARAFDFDRLHFTGDAIPLGSDVPQFPTAWASFAVSRSGAIAYRTRSDFENRLCWRDRVGRELDCVVGAGRYKHPALSPDGTKLAVLIGDGIDEDVWIHDLERGVPTRLTSSPGMKDHLAWSPDGSRVVYSRHGPKVKHNNLYVSTLTDGETTSLNVPGALVWVFDWSDDGKWIAYGNGGDIWLVPMSGDQDPFPRFETRFEEWGATFSPDGRWLAYSSDESGRDEIYVAAVVGAGRGVRVSTNGGGGAVWRKDGTELIYASDRGVMAVPISLRQGELVPGRPTELFSAHVEPIRVTSDGERLLVLEEIELRESAVRMILAWMDEPHESS